MKSNALKKIKDLYVKLSYILTLQQKLIGIVVVISALITAMFELLGVSIIVPLIHAIVNPMEIRNNRFFILFEKHWGSISNNELIVVIIVGVMIVYLIKNIVFCINAWVRLKYSCKIQRECSVRMLSTYLSRDYIFFLNNNVNELIQGTVGDIGCLYCVIFAILQIITQLAIIAFIAAYMIYVDWLIALGVVVSALACLIAISYVFRTGIREAGIAIRKYSVKANKILLEVFSGVKEVIVLDKKDFYVREYEDCNVIKQKYLIKQGLGTEMPAYIIETVCIIGIMSVLCARILGVENPEMFIATLSTFALGAFRILPGLGKLASSINTITTNSPNINTIYKNLKDAEEYSRTVHQEQLTDSEMDGPGVGFSDYLELRDITFAYDKEKKGNVIENVSLKIRKGESIAFIGETGAGKSTLGDIILGVLKPQSGKVYVDGTDISTISKKWSALVGFVPQSIYLSDATIRNNVAFGEREDEIDDTRVVESLKKANVWTFIESLPDGIFTEIGDRGVRLSGGQRQRIGIARALYHDPQIMILDEATSALDNDTEKVVMDAIDSLHGHMTLVIIAHRLTTIRKCDRIFECVDKGIKELKYVDIKQ